ncbi:F-box/FBD/LRR-repeat protein At1g13570-like isoform X3 [Trifolium pratense]|uniref:F-box/FBD/LRR-repeat protein At1g13570-like isoform X3 n=1 Tax=Trifolium pratense TaxID=57577 RepID=UPI001E693E3C|nr:F-box/FBD/LRR-repeat protein At1g13570-like isoform X3 [Trifolium pratense]
MEENEKLESNTNKSLLVVYIMSSLMTRSTKKANCGDHIDRISDLPSNVIDGILKDLNISELVSTSILSRNWRYMWMSVPELVFRKDFFSRFEDLDDLGPEISRIITDILFLHNGPIYKFSLDIPWLSKKLTITTEYLNKWILFLSKRGIKDLQLLNNGWFFFKMPSHIFSCQELTHFTLSGFNLSVPPNFCGFKKLLDLCLECNIYEFGALENLISGCPLLEKLSIILYGDLKSVCLKKAKNLIDLRIKNYHVRGVSDLIISLPKIQRLTMESYENDGEQEPDQPEQLDLECNSCCLSQLQTVNINISDTINFKHAMSLIRFILANSSSLKTLTFKVGFCHKILDAAMLSSIPQDLLCMKRASQRARVEFRHL